MRWLIIILVLTVLFSGCIFQTKTDTDKITSICVNECKSWLNAGKDLSNGPCLLNPIPDFPGWVCDVAHSPRQNEIDNRPENQCSEYGKTASHFIEVDTKCEFIRAI